MSRHEAVVVGKTLKGKEIAYRVPENEALYEIMFVGGGQLPKELQGRWSDPRQIENAIKVYLYREVKVEPVKDEFKEAVKAAKKRPSKLTEK